ncbi:MAG: lamin tail domain-containing protein [Myxococcota bacterium]
MGLRLLSVLTLMVGCGQAPIADPVAADSDAVFRTKDNGGPNGMSDYCDGTVLCANGEGDCDNDGQCEAGLVCANDLGDNFGLHWSTDVCAPAHCTDGVLSGDESAIDFGGSCGAQCTGTPGAQTYCHPGCECAVGEGDCNVDADCQAGLICGNNNGASFGFHFSVDVCVSNHCTNGVQDADETAIDYGGADCGTGCSGQNGDQEGYCTTGCPCAYGEGDCDSDAECQPGLSCRNDLGGRFGIDPLHDVCVSPFTMADVLPGDLVISEFMSAPLAIPQSSGQWFEVYNATTNEIDVNGMNVRDVNTNFVVAGSHIVPPHGYFTFVRTTNVGFVGGYDYPNTFFLADAADSIILETSVGGTELDRVVWTNAWAKQSGRSRVLGRNYYGANNNVSSSWCIAQTTYGSGDYGSPNAINRLCP